MIQKPVLYKYRNFVRLAHIRFNPDLSVKNRQHVFTCMNLFLLTNAWEHHYIFPFWGKFQLIK